MTEQKETNRGKKLGANREVPTQVERKHRMSYVSGAPIGCQGPIGCLEPRGAGS